MPTIPAPKGTVITNAADATLFARRRFYGLYLHYRTGHTRADHYHADLGALAAAMLRIVEDVAGAQAAVTVGTRVDAAYRAGTLAQLNSDLPAASRHATGRCVYPPGVRLTTDDHEAIAEYAQYLAERRRHIDDPESDPAGSDLVDSTAGGAEAG
jgi:hypothetical protein